MLKSRWFCSCIPLFYRFSPLMPVIVCHSFQSVGSVGATQQLHPLTLGRADFCAPATEHMPGSWPIQALCACKQTVSSLKTWALNVCPITACWNPVEPQVSGCSLTYGWRGQCCCPWPNAQTLCLLPADIGPWKCSTSMQAAAQL